MNFEEYRKLDLLDLSRLLKSKELSAQEVCETAQQAHERINPKINAVSFSFFDEPRTDIPLSNPFAGAPFLIKNLGLHMKGHPLTYSSRFCADYISDYDSTLVSRFKEAGLNILGRTNVPEFGIFGVTESELAGICRNPWSLQHTPGGSSGGSAAAVAAGIVPAAQADDGGGSIRIPASCCGLVGLKPTRARTPLGPRKFESWAGLVSNLAVTKTIRDTAKLLDVSQGPESGYAYFAPPPQGPYLNAIEKPVTELRIGYSTASVLGQTTGVACQEAVKETASALASLGHHVEEFDLELNKEELRLTYFIIVAVSIANEIMHWAKILNRKPVEKYFEKSTWFLFCLGQTLTALEYQWAIEQTRKVTRVMDEAFEKYDILIHSTLAHPPSPVNQLNLSSVEQLGIKVMGYLPLKGLMLKAVEKLAAEAFERSPNTQIYNFSGMPAISLPTYVNKDGLPIGVQLGAAMGQEELLLNVGQQLENKYQWHQRLNNLEL